MKLDNETFQCIVENTPLISIDIIVEHKGKILLGKRKNKPAKGYYFTTGGRIYKNEKLQDAIIRIAKEELGIVLHNLPVFIGVFEHFYDDGIFENTSTHYINLAYRCQLDSLKNLPKEQHEKYRLFSIEELMQSDLVHKYVKDYFKKRGN